MCLAETISLLLPVRLLVCAGGHRPVQWPHLEVSSRTEGPCAGGAHQHTASGAFLPECVDGLLQLTQQLAAYGILCIAA